MKNVLGATLVSLAFCTAGLASAQSSLTAKLSDFFVVEECVSLEPSTCSQAALELIHLNGVESTLAVPALKKALKILFGSCMAGEAQACVDAGTYILEGDRGSPTSIAFNENLTEKAAPKDVDVEGAKLALADALQWSCQESFAHCVTYSLTFRFGLGRPKDLRLFGNMNEDACNRNVAAGCTQIGAAYQNGIGRPMNLRRAEEYFLRGCSLHSTASCQNAMLLQLNR